MPVSRSAMVLIDSHSRSFGPFVFHFGADFLCRDEGMGGAPGVPSRKPAGAVWLRDTVLGPGGYGRREAGRLSYERGGFSAGTARLPCALRRNLDTIW
jgi:hypothetical protein